MTDEPKPSKELLKAKARRREASERRAMAFAEATSKAPGKRDVYGAGKEPKAKR